MEPTTIALLLTGALIGATSGLMGIGGAIVLVPALTMVFGFSQARAQGTSLGALVPPIGIFAALQYYRAGLLDVRAALLIGGGFVVGAFLGATAVPHVPLVWLRRAFATLLIYVAVQMMFSEGKKTGAVLPGAIAMGALWLAFFVRRALRKKADKPRRPPPRPDTEYHI